MDLGIRAEPSPTPFQWLPSNEWDGIDGNWSSFKINVGDSGDNSPLGQNFRVLISTSATASYIPAQADFCSSSEQNYTDADACDQSRGIESYRSGQSNGFQQNLSAAWQDIGSYEVGLSTKDVNYATDLEATWGTDNVGLGDASAVSPMIARSPTALLKANSTFWVGMFGLSKTPTNIGGNPYITWLEEYYNGSNIPSLSYAYTAGQRYGNGDKGILASLTLGGYDSSRIDPRNKVIVSMPGSTTGEDVSLLVGVQALQVRNGQESPRDLISTSDTFNAKIDSTLPYLWLPGPACDALENEYGLTWDNESQLYILSSDNERDNAGKTLTIRVANNQNSPVFANINLPFEALNLQASPPLVANASRYFPLKRSPTSNYILGRAFLQESYLIVDYQRRNFTVAQAYTNDPMPNSNIVPIFTEGNSPVISNTGGTGSNKLSPGAIAGIVIAIVAFALALAGVAFWFWRKRRNEKTKLASPPHVNEKGDDFSDARRSPLPQYPSDNKRNTYQTDHSASELDDPHSRSQSGQGWHGHRRSESGSNRTELMGSPPVGTNEKEDYFKWAPVEPMPLAELPGDHGISELPLRRPHAKRNRSSGSGGSASGRPAGADSERPEAIREEDGEHSPILDRGETASPGVTVEPEAYKDVPEDGILPEKPTAQQTPTTQDEELEQTEQNTAETNNKPST